MHRVLLATALLVCWTLPTSAQDMVGVSWAGDVYQLDSTTGTGSLIGNAGNYNFNCLAKRSDGKLFSSDAFGSSNDIYEIDPSSGAATLVVNVSLTSVRALAFGPGDVLYAVNDGGGITAPDDLYTVDLGAGTVTLVGSIGFAGVQGLAWGNGTLYAWESGSGSGTGAGLLTIDPATGAGTDVNPAIGGTAVDVQSLTFDAQGDLWGGRDELFRVDLSTGALTLVGSGGYSDIRGLEFTGSSPSGPTIYCTAKAASIAGCVPTIGGPSATASLTAGSGSYDVTCGPVPGGRNVGVVTYTTNGPLTTPIQTMYGFQCIQSGPGQFNVQPVQFPGGTIGACDGSYTFDFGAYLAGPNPDPALVPGATVDMQVLYRDPLNTGTANLSNAMSFTLVP